MTDYSKSDFIENNDSDACEFGWTLNLEDDKARDEILENQQNSKNWKGIIDFFMKNSDLHITDVLIGERLKDRIKVLEQQKPVNEEMKRLHRFVLIELKQVYEGKKDE